MHLVGLFCVLKYSKADQINDKDISETFALGANYYLFKPISQQKLVDHLKNFLSIDWHKKSTITFDKYFVDG